MLADYHVHTYLCKHATGLPETYIDQGVAYGLDEIGFADHCPWPENYDTDYRMSPSEYPKYKEMLEDLQKRYDSGKIAIRYGIEADWVPGRMEKVFDLFDNEDFDYVLGSIHYTDDFPFDNPSSLKCWEKNGCVEKVWKRYWELMLELVTSGKFDILSHLDLPKKFGYFPSWGNNFLEKLDNIFAEAGSRRMAIEINTAGLRKPVGEIYPSLEILKLAQKHGLLLVLGSDAHKPEEVGANFTEACELAKAAGYNEICTFDKRTPMKHPIPQDLKSKI